MRPSHTKAVGTLVNELRDLVVAYVKQETVLPIKQLGRFVAFGLAGAVFLVIGAGLLTLALVRAVQVEFGAVARQAPSVAVGHLSGDWSWVPYVIGFAFCALIAAVAASRINKVDSRP